MTQGPNHTGPHNPAYNAGHRTGRASTGLVSEVAEGMRGFVWTVTHPGKSFMRTMGVIGMFSGCTAVIGGIAYLLAGQPGTAQFDIWRPSTWGASAVDAVRPGLNTGQQLIRMQLNEQGEPAPSASPGPRM